MAKQYITDVSFFKGSARPRTHRRKIVMGTHNATAELVDLIEGCDMVDLMGSLDKR